MGQGQSQEPPTIDTLNHQLTEAFATKCLSPLELYIFKTVFKEHATISSEVTYWTQDSLAKFLQLPDNPGLPIIHVIFQLVGYIGAFPFPSHAPAILTKDALLKVVVVMTGRHTKVLRSNKRLWEREIWRSLAVLDRTIIPQKGNDDSGHETAPGQAGFMVDRAIEDDQDDEADEDGLELVALDAMEATDVFKQDQKHESANAMIPPDNFLTLIMFLILIAPLQTQETLSLYLSDLNDETLQQVRSRAKAILTSFGVESHPGISYMLFRKVVANVLPNLFEPLKTLFETFLFSTDLNLSKKSPTTREDPAADTPAEQSSKPSVTRPILPDPNGELMTKSTMSQLSFVLPPSTIFRNLTLLYSGAKDGFSMPTFQTSVFNWQAPSLVIVSGSIIDDSKSYAAREFMSTLPYRRFSSSITGSKTVTYAAYIPIPWKQTHKSSFGTKETLLMQLSPQHDVFKAADATSYAYFNRRPAKYPGVGFGSPLAEENSSSAARSAGHSRQQSEIKIPLGPVSLHMDDSLTYAVFTHDSEGGGTFAPSTLPKSCRLSPTAKEQETTSPLANLSSPVASPPTSPTFQRIAPSRAAPVSEPLVDWQDVFEIECLEVYGLGGAEIAAEQKRAHEWEEREAERRRRINVGTGDIEADRELLKMAGLIGQGQSGGSV